MRSMKFKIIFVTTCLALNVSGLFADPGLLLKVSFATTDDQAQLIKGYGFTNSDEFNPVNQFKPIVAKSGGENEIPPFMKQSVKNDWQMLKMADGKKYIELAPGTEIYIKRESWIT